MQVAMLGPVEVRDSAGSPREVSGMRLRALLVLPTGDSPVIAEVLTGLADVALRREDARQAATLLGAAEGMRGIRDRSDHDGARVTAACARCSARLTTARPSAAGAR